MSLWIWNMAGTFRVVMCRNTERNTLECDSFILSSRTTSGRLHTKGTRWSLPASFSQHYKKRRWERCQCLAIISNTGQVGSYSCGLMGFSVYLKIDSSIENRSSFHFFIDSAFIIPNRHYFSIFIYMLCKNRKIMHTSNKGREKFFFERMKT